MAGIIGVTNEAEGVSLLDAGDCDVLTTDRSALPPFQTNARKILTGVVSREPLAPCLRQNDQEWVDLVRWVVNGMVLAEHYQIGRANVLTLDMSSLRAEARQLLGENKSGWPTKDFYGFDLRKGMSFFFDFGIFER